MRTMRRVPFCTLSGDAWGVSLGLLSSLSLAVSASGCALLLRKSSMKRRKDESLFTKDSSKNMHSERPAYTDTDTGTNAHTQTSPTTNHPTTGPVSAHRCARTPLDGRAARTERHRRIHPEALSERFHEIGDDFGGHDLDVERQGHIVHVAGKQLHEPVDVIRVQVLPQLVHQIRQRTIGQRAACAPHRAARTR